MKIANKKYRNNPYSAEKSAYEKHEQVENLLKARIKNLCVNLLKDGMSCEKTNKKNITDYLRLVLKDLAKIKKQNPFRTSFIESKRVRIRIQNSCSDYTRENEKAKQKELNSYIKDMGIFNNFFTKKNYKIAEISKICKTIELEQKFYEKVFEVYGNIDAFREYYLDNNYKLSAKNTKALPKSI